MVTATVQTQTLKSLKTGSDLKYPVVMKSPFDLSMYTFRLEVQGATELAIGDICIFTAADVLDASSAGAESARWIVLDTPWNKSILEKNGSTVNKTSQFAAGDKIDVLLLVPGMIISMKIEAKSDLVAGDSLICNDTAGQLTNGVTAGAVIGISLTELNWTDVADELFYGAVLIK